MRRHVRHRRLPVLLAGLAVAAVAGAVPATVGAEDGGAERQVPEPVAVSPDDAEQQAGVLAAEDRRIVEVRTVTSLARWQGRNWTTPYRLSTAAGYTLVLTPRADPYTIDDLLELAPQTFLRMSDGSYLLTEHVVVMARAELALGAPGGLTLRMASGPQGFVTIVSFGGELRIIGDEAAPVSITSWDTGASGPDAREVDGRAYLRAIGGQFEARHAELADLGFWSGRTGGLSLTGTDRPNTGAIENGPVVDEADTLLEDVTWQPAGPLEDGEINPTFDLSVDAVDYVSSALDDVTVSRSAYGLFVSGANGVQISDSHFDDNRFGGVVLHRYVTNGVITATTASGNGGDGFDLGRTTTGVAISESTADHNAGNGFHLDGRALAEEPSVVGASLRAYGNNSVSGSTAIGNGAYGIDVQGGFNINVQNNRVAEHDMGIMVGGPAERITITGNTVSDSDRHGIALVDGVTGATLTGNVVEGSRTGVYVRASTAQVKGNTVESATAHGVSFVGDVGGSEVAYNVLAGEGASAVDVIRSDGSITRNSNNVDGWHDTTPWYFWFKKLLQPMTALWAALALLIVVSAIRSRRKNGVIVHPYAHQMGHQGLLPVPEPTPADVPATTSG